VCTRSYGGDSGADHNYRFEMQQRNLGANLGGVIFSACRPCRPSPPPPPPRADRLRPAASHAGAQEHVVEPA
jgi:hypothetical protein